MNIKESRDLETDSQLVDIVQSERETHMDPVEIEDH